MAYYSLITARRGNPGRPLLRSKRSECRFCLMAVRGRSAPVVRHGAAAGRVRPRLCKTCAGAGQWRKRPTRRQSVSNQMRLSKTDPLRTWGCRDVQK
ncbi:hypothetical protein KTE62_19495 [Burkholderia multivorans]|nr:hypothetical protein [Burkholderia multivorans]